MGRAGRSVVAGRKCRTRRHRRRGGPRRGGWACRRLQGRRQRHMGNDARCRVGHGLGDRADHLRDAARRLAGRRARRRARFAGGRSRFAYGRASLAGSGSRLAYRLAGGGTRAARRALRWTLQGGRSPCRRTAPRGGAPLRRRARRRLPRRFAASRSALCRARRGSRARGGRPLRLPRRLAPDRLALGSRFPLALGYCLGHVVSPGGCEDTGARRSKSSSASDCIRHGRLSKNDPLLSCSSSYGRRQSGARKSRVSGRDMSLRRHARGRKTRPVASEKTGPAPAPR